MLTIKLQHKLAYIIARKSVHDSVRAFTKKHPKHVDMWTDRETSECSKSLQVIGKRKLEK